MLRFVGRLNISLLCQWVVELASGYEPVEPGGVGLICSIALFLHLVPRQVFQENFSQGLVVKVASWWLDSILPEAPFLVPLHHVLDLRVGEQILLFRCRLLRVIDRLEGRGSIIIF